MLRKILLKLGLMAASLVVAFLVGEVVARLAEPGPFSLWDKRPYEEHPDLPHVHKRDFAGRWDGTWYATNSMGMRGPAIAVERAPDEFRVIAVGDSCTFGKGVLERDTWPRQLETALTETLAPDRHAVVANLGTNGYSGKDYRHVVLETGLPLKPDLVVLGYNLNDFPNVIRSVDRQLYSETKNVRQLVPKKVRDAIGQLALVRYARSQYYDMRREKAYAQAEQIAAETGKKNWEEAIARQEQYLGDIVKASRETGAEVAVFLFPYESQVYLEDYDTSPIDRLRNICDRLGVVFVDLAEEFRAHVRASDPPARLFIRGDRYHPNAEGYRIVAERVLDVVAESGWLDAPSSDASGSDARGAEVLGVGD